MRTVSLTGSSFLYGLQIRCQDVQKTGFRHILCKNLSFEEIKSVYKPKELYLTIKIFPTKFEEAARNDRPTLFYLYQHVLWLKQLFKLLIQAKNIYYSNILSINDVEMALEVGCLDIR